MGRKAIVIEGRTFEVEGYERFFLKELADLGLTAEDVVHPAPMILYLMGGIWRKYTPDFYVPCWKTLVEVKSEWTYRQNAASNRAKWGWIRTMSDYRLLVIVYDADGRLVWEEG